MANKIAVDVAKLLVVMFESSQENDSWFDGDELKRISGLEPDEINDAVDFLSNEGLIEQMNFIGTFPFKFGQVMLNSRGRYKYYDITSKSNSHAMNPIRHTPPAGSPSIFLSHSSKDKFFVRKLAEQLKNHGVTVWLDEAEINVGDSLTERVGKAIQETDFVGVVLSHNSVNSEWVQKELQAAMQKEIKGRRVVVLPMLLEPVEIPVFLRDKLYADFTSQQKFEESFPKLLRSLGAEADLGVTHSEERAGITMATPDESAPKATVIMTLPPTDRGVQLGLGGLRDFEDIKIVELDDGRTYKPDLDKALYKVYLKLSARPPEEWNAIFDAERQFPRHSMWRRAWIEGQDVVVYCVPNEIEKYHLKDLKQDVSNSNAKYRQYLVEEEQRRAREAQKKRRESDEITDLKRKLNFD